MILNGLQKDFEEFQEQLKHFKDFERNLKAPTLNPTRSHRCVLGVQRLLIDSILDAK